MHASANMLDMLLENLLLLTYACAMGGLVWSLLLLKPRRTHVPAEGDLASQSLALMRWGALGMAVVQLAKLATHAWLLVEAFQRWPFQDYVYTLQCQAGLSRALVAGGLGMAGLWLGRLPGSHAPLVPHWTDSSAPSSQWGLVVACGWAQRGARPPDDAHHSCISWPSPSGWVESSNWACCGGSSASAHT